MNPEHSTEAQTPGGDSEPTRSQPTPVDETRAISAFDRPPPGRVGEPSGSGLRYRLIRQHARGGLGVVHLARDEELHREVALKEIRPDCSDHAEYRARFLREAEVTGRLEHPGIVPVHAIGHHDDGRPFYVMRFIRGETLKEAIARLHRAGPPDRLSRHALVGRFAAACQAIGYAHSRKVLHRDIKPGNIMLGPYGETLVVDWGLAKPFDRPEGDSEQTSDEGTLRPETDSGVTPTLAGSEVGTIGYMSPEQAAGRVGELGPSSDVYSLGATFYCLIAGRPPFEGCQPAEFRRRVREGDFPLPRKLDPTAPAALEAVCLKAMALRPVDRYPSAEALAEELRRWRAGEPVLAYREPFPARLGRWARRHRTGLAASAVLVACLVAGLAARTIQLGQERARAVRDRVDAEAKRLVAEADLNLARGVLGMLAEELAGAECAYLANSGPFRARVANRLLGFYQELVSKHPADPVVGLELARGCRLAANIARSMDQFDGPRKLYEEALALLDRPEMEAAGHDEVGIERVATRHDLGELLRGDGQPRAAEAEFLRALAELGRAGLSPGFEERARREEAKIRLDLGEAQAETGRPKEAAAEADRAIVLFDRLASKPSPALVDSVLRISARVGRADAARDLGDRESAWKGLEDADRRVRSLLDEREPGPDVLALSASIRIEQGRLIADLDGKLADSEARFVEAATILGRLNQAHPHVTRFRRDLAVAINGRSSSRASSKAGAIRAAAAKDAETARKVYTALALANPRNYDYPTQLGRSEANLGRVARAEGRVEEARERFRVALAQERRALGLNREGLEARRLAEALIFELESLGPEAATGTPHR